jgi:hypothetical protein
MTNKEAVEMLVRFQSLNKHILMSLDEIEEWYYDYLDQLDDKE